MTNLVLGSMQRFADAYGKDLTVQGTRWRYYALGQGPALAWMTGGLRRAAFGFAFLERLARRHRVVAPDYPPLMTFDAMAAGFDAIVQAEGLERFALGGQSVWWSVGSGLPGPPAGGRGPVAALQYRSSRLWPRVGTRG